MMANERSLRRGAVIALLAALLQAAIAIVLVGLRRSEIAKQTGCGLLLDLNNVHVASTNQQWTPFRYVGESSLAHPGGRLSAATLLRGAAIAM
jgi:hypothetical protein